MNTDRGFAAYNTEKRGEDRLNADNLRESIQECIYAIQELNSVIEDMGYIGEEQVINEHMDSAKLALDKFSKVVSS